MLKGRWGRQGKNTNKHRDDTKRRAQHLPEEGRDCSGTEEKGPLPGMFMEGFQEEVVFTRLWVRKKRERDIPLNEAAGTKAERNEEYVGPETGKEFSRTRESADGAGKAITCLLRW